MEQDKDLLWLRLSRAPIAETYGDCMRDWRVRHRLVAMSLACSMHASTTPEDISEMNERRPYRNNQINMNN